MKALKSVGVERGDIVFSHVKMEMPGYPGEGSHEESAFQVILDALLKVIGDNGTLLIPTYSYSFCKGEIFDPNVTPSAEGLFSEYFRKTPGVKRSYDPIFSVAGIGPKVDKLFNNLPNECFGKDCIYDRLVHAGAKICNIGVSVRYSAFIHFVEQMANVLYRFPKLFTGYVNKNGKLQKEAWIYNVRILAKDYETFFSHLETYFVDSKLCKKASVGLGEVAAIDCKAFYNAALKKIKKDPCILVDGKPGDPVELEKNRVPVQVYDIHIPPEASMFQMIEALWKIPREIVSDGYTAALEALSKQVPMTIHKYRTGTKCWTWLIPEKWTCFNAYIETLNGERIIDYKNNPLHCVSYSLPFEGIISREDLFNHLYTHPHIPEAIPYIFKPYERDWGLCCAEVTKNSLVDKEYKVVIKTEFSFGELQVGEVIVEGESKESFVLCAHLCHTYMTNDDLTGVAIGLEVMRRLRNKRKPYFTYRFLIVPETIGSIAWLSHNEDLIPKIKGGLFLEMLGREAPHSLQLSFEENTQIDKCLTLALSVDTCSWTGKFRTVIQNDEKQFNAPGVRIPMLSLSRVEKPDSNLWPYREYHSDFDNLSNVSCERLEESVELVLKMINNLEKNLYVINNFKGEVFCSRYGIYIDFYKNPRGHNKLIDVIHLIDGSRTVADISQECSLSFEECMDILDKLEEKGLVYFSRTPLNKSGFDNNKR